MRFEGPDAKGVPTTVTILDDRCGGYTVIGARHVPGWRREESRLKVTADGNSSTTCALLGEVVRSDNPDLLPILADAIQDEDDRTADGEGIDWLLRVLRTYGLKSPYGPDGRFLIPAGFPTPFITLEPRPAAD